MCELRQPVPQAHGQLSETQRLGSCLPGQANLTFQKFPDNVYRKYRES